MLSTRLSNNMVYNPNDPIFKKTMILNNEDKGYAILIHSITFNETFISGYSDKFDSLMTFSVLLKDIKIIQNKLDKLTYKSQECNTCHKEKWN